MKRTVGLLSLPEPTPEARADEAPPSRRKLTGGPRHGIPDSPGNTTAG